MKTVADTKRAAPPAHDVPQRRDRRLHQRRASPPAQPAHRRGRPRRERAVRDPRPDRSPRRDPGRPPTRWPTPSGSCAPCRPSWSRRSARRWRRSPTPTCCCTSSTAATPTRRARSPRSASVLSDLEARRRQGGYRRQQGRRGRPRGHRPADPPRAALDRRLRPDRPRPRRAARPRRRRAARPDIEVKAVIPYDRGDLVSRLHQDSEVLSTEHREDGTFVHAKVHPPLLSRPRGLPRLRRSAGSQPGPGPGWQSMRRDAQPVRPEDRSERGARAAGRVTRRFRPLAAVGALPGRPAMGHGPRGLLGRR